ncbi:DUF2975 domain-containing protein [Natronospora cellulosivora (SeqCode)]
MYYKKSLAKILKIIIYLLMVVLLFLMLALVIQVSEGTINLFEFIPRFLFSGGIVVILFFIKRFVDSIVNKDPFSKKNIVHFKYIGYVLFVFAAIDLLVNLKTFSGFMIISWQPYFAIHMSFYMYIAFGIFSLILSEVFRQAYDVKKENDLTI